MAADEKNEEKRGGLASWRDLIYWGMHEFGAKVLVEPNKPVSMDLASLRER